MSRNTYRFLEVFLQSLYVTYTGIFVNIVVCRLVFAGVLHWRALGVNPDNASARPGTRPVSGPRAVLDSCVFGSNPSITSRYAAEFWLMSV